MLGKIVLLTLAASVAFAARRPADALVRAARVHSTRLKVVAQYASLRWRHEKLCAYDDVFVRNRQASNINASPFSPKPQSGGRQHALQQGGQDREDARGDAEQLAGERHVLLKRTGAKSAYTCSDDDEQSDIFAMDVTWVLR